MKALFNTATICGFMFLLFMVMHAKNVDDTFLDSKFGSFISKSSSNQRVVRETGDMNIESEDQESQPDMRLLTKRNLRALQNSIFRVVEAVENFEQKICQKQPEENSTLTEHIEKNSAMLVRIEKEMQKNHTEVNYKSIFEKFDNLEKDIVKKPDLQSIQNNILHSVQSQLKPNGRCSDYTKEEPKVTKEYLLKYLKSISDSNIISGINIYLHSPLSSGKLVHEITGIHPGIWSASKNHFSEGILKWDSYIDEAISQWNNNSLVILQWFPCPPTLSESCSHEINTVRFNTTEWNELVTDGGRINNLWKIRLNSMVVPFLKRLESAGVVVIFDPLILININIWWWTGNRDAISGGRRLYQITHDYLTKEHNLNSIIWKWSLYNTPDLHTYMEQYWPGEEYVDVASVMVWNSPAKEPSTPVYEKMVEIAGDKPMAMEWMYAVPSAELLKRQPRWNLFTVEDLMLKSPEWNNASNVQAAFDNPSVINRDGIDIFKKTNYALKGRATASSVQNADLKENQAIDGNNATRWSSEFSDPQWIQIDFGQVRVVKMVRIFWESAFATGYLIQTSQDKMTWTIIHEEYNGRGGLEEISINPPQLARYVKMFGFKRGTGYGYSIFEIEVY